MKRAVLILLWLLPAAAAVAGLSKLDALDRVCRRTGPNEFQTQVFQGVLDATTMTATQKGNAVLLYSSLRAAHKDDIRGMYTSSTAALRGYIRVVAESHIDELKQAEIARLTAEYDEITSGMATDD